MASTTRTRARTRWSVAPSADAVVRSARVDGAGTTRPWLQDFTLGAPVYAGAEVRAQIQATYDAGVDEWILWNPGSRYTVSALEPVGGFEREPLVRVAGVLTPVSRRYVVMDSIAALPVPVEEPLVLEVDDSSLRSHGTRLLGSRLTARQAPTDANCSSWSRAYRPPAARSS